MWVQLRWTGHGPGPRKQAGACEGKQTGYGWGRALADAGRRNGGDNTAYKDTLILCDLHTHCLRTVLGGRGAVRAPQLPLLALRLFLLKNPGFDLLGHLPVYPARWHTLLPSSLLGQCPAQGIVQPKTGPQSRAAMGKAVPSAEKGTLAAPAPAVTVQDQEGPARHTGTRTSLLRKEPWQQVV